MLKCINIQISKTNALIGRIVPHEFRLHDNNSLTCDIIVHEIFSARRPMRPSVKVYSVPKKIEVYYRIFTSALFREI